MTWNKYHLVLLLSFLLKQNILKWKQSQKSNGFFSMHDLFVDADGVQIYRN